MPNIKLTIEYDGTDFAGWQRQKNGRSVQEEIERALAQITQKSVTLVGAGRTDAGVHARGQTANFKTDSQLSPLDYFRALNGLLPDDIAVTEAVEVGDDFSARYSAVSRAYKYTILRRPSALMRRYSWQLSYDFNINLMREAASVIRSTSDFQAFCKVEAEVDHYRCRIDEAEWHEEEDGTLILSIRANRFLHGMVRALVGTMVDVGRGYTTIGDFCWIIESKDRRHAGQAAPPQGLCLISVHY
ncbi:MAG TPA: tRNA pseudouridine(38-40) synthase TruA [Bacteroidota bacterium]|nr:tRNA pseudouridine(38-40) synthase TruA [Bacteroidota bacterium]